MSDCCCISRKTCATLKCFLTKTLFRRRIIILNGETCYGRGRERASNLINGSTEHVKLAGSEDKMMQSGLPRRCMEFIKKETVLSIALLLAVISSLVILPDAEYLNYIDFRTLGILFCLMAVMAGLQKIGVFRWIAGKLLQQVRGVRQLVLILVMLCFIFSMFITNDVALITFVPFTFTVLKLAGEEQAERLAVPVVVMQTIAANLGSMLTPIGNPQNLYLYGKSGMGMGEFLGLMLPYTLVSLVLLVVWCLWIGKGTAGEDVGGAGEDIGTAGRSEGATEHREVSVEWQRTSFNRDTKALAAYLILFVLCLLTVARVVPYWITLIVVIAVMCLVDRQVLARVDYALLLTFVGFFVFIGNMGRIPAFRSFLENIISGNEVITAIVSSQVISNVPAALLLSGFTQNYSALIIGTNLGGLGTLIASMASLISFKYIGKEKKEQKGTYLIYFTVANVIFLAILLVLAWWLG